MTLDAVADVVATTGPSEIHRADQTRVAVVSANLRDIDLGAAMREVQQMVSEQPLGAGVGLHIGGQGEELAQAAKSLIFAFGLAIFLVYLVMASQFESLLHPFVILFTIPLALVGAILALMLTGKPISVVVFIGLILLVGLVTKNAIILIDKVNQLREAGVAKQEALVEGARSRLRPIIMTTLCTLFGFLPLAVAMGEGAEVRAPMAITVIGGLLVSTLLTLLVIPVVYDLMDRRGDAYYRERGRKHAGWQGCTATKAARQAWRNRHEYCRVLHPPPGHHHHVLRVAGGDRPDRFVPAAAGGAAGHLRALPVRADSVYRLDPGGSGTDHHPSGRGVTGDDDRHQADAFVGDVRGGIDLHRVQRLGPRHRHCRVRRARAYRRDPQ